MENSILLVIVLNFLSIPLLLWSYSFSLKDLSASHLCGAGRGFKIGNACAAHWLLQFTFKTT